MSWKFHTYRKLTFCCIVVIAAAPSILFSQSLQRLQADFSILETQDSGKMQDVIILGHLSIDKLSHLTILDINFPQKEKWVIQDATLTKFRADTIFFISALNFGDEDAFINDLFSYKGNDFGLAEMGFTIQEVNNEGPGLVSIAWLPPEHLTSVIHSASTKVKDNLLYGVNIIDNERLASSQTYYEKYEIIGNVPIPTIISTQLQNSSNTIYKKIKLRNVKIQ